HRPRRLLAQGGGLQEMAGGVQGDGADQVGHEQQAALHEAHHPQVPAREGLRHLAADLGDPLADLALVVQHGGPTTPPAPPPPRAPPREGPPPLAADLGDPLADLALVVQHGGPIARHAPPTPRAPGTSSSRRTRGSPGAGGSAGWPATQTTRSSLATSGRRSR